MNVINLVRLLSKLDPDYPVFIIGERGEYQPLQPEDIRVIKVSPVATATLDVQLWEADKDDAYQFDAITFEKIKNV